MPKIKNRKNKINIESMYVALEQISREASRATTYAIAWLANNPDKVEKFLNYLEMVPIEKVKIGAQVFSVVFLKWAFAVQNRELSQLKQIERS